MSHYQTVRCIRCGRPLEGTYYDACPHCRKETGKNINYETVYDLRGAKLPLGKSREPGIFKYREFFPIQDSTKPVSLNEGNTPLYRLERMGKLLGLNALYVKDESKNPTCSHKDRLLAVIATKAVEEGAPGITVSSTGNQGIAAAAYASAAGLPCHVFSTPGVSDTMKTVMQVYGAKVFITETMEKRVQIMQHLVRELHYAPASGLMAPPIGSSVYGLDGYKSIAFELYEQMGESLPDWIVFPMSYGDAMYGMWKGLKDLQAMGYCQEIPHIGGAESFGSAKTTIAQNEEFPVGVPTKPSIQPSIAVGYATYQAVNAIRDSKGAAECSEDQESLEMQKLLARTEGIYAETASVSSLVVAKKLLEQGKIDPNQKVVVVITSTGLKDPATSRLYLPDPPAIEPTPESWREALKSVYGEEC